MNLIETEPGLYSVLLDGASYEVRVLGSEVTVNGHRFEIAIEEGATMVRVGRALFGDRA